MPETITRPSPIIVQAIQKDGVPKYRHLLMPIARLVDEDGNFVRFQYGKIYGPTRGKDGKLIPGQKFEYVGDPVGLENDPHLEVISDPDGLVEKAIRAKYAAIAAERKRAAEIEALKRGEEADEDGRPAPASPPAAGASLVKGRGRWPKKDAQPSPTQTAPTATPS